MVESNNNHGGAPSRESVPSETGTDVPVEMFIPVPGLKFTGSFEDGEVQRKIDLDDPKTVEGISDALTTRVPSRLTMAFFTGKRKGWVIPVVGGFLLAAGIYEFGVKGGEDVLNLWGRLVRKSQDTHKK